MRGSDNAGKVYARIHNLRVEARRVFLQRDSFARETFLDARRSVRRDWRLTRGDKLETRCPKGRFVGALHMASVGGTLNDS